jgi:hypothetical protein
MSKNIKNAKGKSGILCRSINGRYFFRVYQGDDFIDYELRHDDLAITITDEQAAFYEKDGQYFLDHSPEVFGK